MNYGLIAERVGHSYSKVIHSMLADYEYELCAISKDELDGFMREKDFKAINVTIPYKQAVIPYLDYVSDGARQIGAVNTVVNQDGKLYGYNTDFFGLKELILKMGLDLVGKKALVLGTGGTSRTARAVLGSLGAKDVIAVGRMEKPDCITYGEAYEKHTDADVIVNTTPVGMFPDVEGCPIDLSRFQKLSGVIDAVYNPLRSTLVTSARERGILAEGGLYMLVCQAVKACEIFLDRELPDGKADEVYAKILRDKENIVLIGMPSCGKTTVGRIVAERTGRELYDLDEEIVKSEKRTIPEIFSESGEKIFRDIESRVLDEKLSALSGAVIATGGGAVLRGENVSRLKKNGRLYFLDRPIELLIPTPDRPTALTREAIEKRYAERLPIYKGAADERVISLGTAEDAARAVIDLHYKEV